MKHVLVEKKISKLRTYFLFSLSWVSVIEKQKEEGLSYKMTLKLVSLIIFSYKFFNFLH